MIAAPLAIIFVFYGLIFSYVNRKHNENLQNMNIDGPKHRIKDSKIEIKLAKTLFIASVTFVVCWTPYLVGFFLHIELGVALPRITALGVILLGHANSVMNFIIYGATNQRYRDGFLHFLTCGKTTKKRVVSFGTMRHSSSNEG